MEAQFATIGDAHSLLYNPEVNLRKYSTVEEYHDALVKHEENTAAELIDAGLEPYLVNLDAVELSMHPFIAVHDIMTTMQDGLIGIDTGSKVRYFGRNVLLAWRG